MYLGHNSKNLRRIRRVRNVRYLIQVTYIKQVSENISFLYYSNLVQVQVSNLKPKFFSLLKPINTRYLTQKQSHFPRMMLFSETLLTLNLQVGTFLSYATYKRTINILIHLQKSLLATLNQTNFCTLVQFSKLSVNYVSSLLVL